MASSTGDDTTNNLFTDLGPLIALFGEQVSKQFLSQSLGFADAILFGMAPLGIITGIVSAIRLGGYRWLRAIIGRSSETRGSAGIELTSATSNDIGELWDGSSVVRLQGTPSIITVFFEAPMESEDTGEVEHSPSVPLMRTDDRSLLSSEFHPKVTDFEGAKEARWASGQSKKALRKPHNRGGWEQFDDSITMEEMPTTTSSKIPPIPPNLALNIIQRPSRLLTRLLAILAIVIQSTVFVWGAWMSYHIRPLRVDQRFAYPMLVGGTCLVSFGMVLCSWLVQKSSINEVWSLYNPFERRKRPIKLMWLQRRQVVNDQLFPSFAIECLESNLMLSYTNETLSERHQLWVLVGSITSLIGFVSQFVGLRNLHWSVSIAQLIAMTITTGIRVFVRMPFSGSAQAENPPSNLELEWMAKSIQGYSKFRPSFDIPLTEALQAELAPIILPRSSVGDFISTRLALGEIAKSIGWTSSFHHEATCLKKTIEAVANLLWKSDSCKLRNHYAAAKELIVPINLSYQQVSNSSPNSKSKSFSKRLNFALSRQKLGDSWLEWTTDVATLEAVLSLWAYELWPLVEGEEEEFLETGEFQQRQFIWAMTTLTPTSSMDFDWWVHRGAAYFGLDCSACQGVVFEFRGREITRSPFVNRSEFAKDILQIGSSRQQCVITFSTFPRILARYLLSGFLRAFLRAIDHLEGAILIVGETQPNSPQGIHFEHSFMNAIAESMVSESLLTYQDAYTLLVPGLREAELLPDPLTASFKDVDWIQDPKSSEDYVLIAHIIFRRLRCFRYDGDFVAAEALLKSWHGVELLRTLGGWQPEFQKLWEVMSLWQSKCSGTAWEEIRLSWDGKPASDGLDPVRKTDEAVVAFRNQLNSGNVDLLSADWEALGRLQQLWVLDLHLARKSYASLQDLIIYSLVKNDWLMLFMVMMEIVDLQDFKAADFDMSELLVKAVNREGMLPLHILLLFLRRPLTHRQSLTRTLITAIDEQNIEATRLLLEAGANANCRDQDGQTPLEAAARSSQEPFVVHLLEGGAQLEYALFKNRPSPLAAAIQGSDENVIQLILQHLNYSIDDVYRGYGNLVQIAAGSGKMKILKAILDRGGNVDPLLARAHKSPLQEAAEKGLTGIVEFLLAKGAQADGYSSPAGLSALQLACLNGYEDVVKLLLASGASVNEFTSPIEGLTPLQSAAAGGHVNIAKILITEGADIHATASPCGGLTALQAAVKSGSRNMVDFIMQQGAKVASRPAKIKGRTTFQAACENGDLEILHLILDSEGDIIHEQAISEDNGRTGLQAAAESGHIDVVRTLLNLDVDINSPPARIRGLTALQAAACSGHTRICEMLLDGGADINAAPSDVEGLTALAGACHHGNSELVKLLDERGADIDAGPSTFGGRTALQAAAEKGHDAIVTYLLKKGAYYNERPAWRDGVTTAQFLSPAELEIDPEISIPEWAYGREDTAQAGLLESQSSDSKDRSISDVAKSARKTNQNQLTEFQQAAADGDEVQIDQLLVLLPTMFPNLSRLAYIEDALHPYAGRSALQAAAGSGHDYLVRLFLKEGANVNGPRAAIQGQSALECACEGGHASVVQRLLDAGATLDLDPAQPEGGSAFQLAAWAGHLPVMEMLANHYVSKGPDQTSVVDPATATTNPSIDAPSPATIQAQPAPLTSPPTHNASSLINAPPATTNGLTALQGAVLNGHEKVVEALLSGRLGGAKANIDAEKAKFGGFTVRQALDKFTSEGELEGKRMKRILGL
ncbi:MAG: hypothetical protein Q9227_008823 [Pyrenula ochraceoflavens]